MAMISACFPTGSSSTRRHLVQRFDFLRWNITVRPSLYILFSEPCVVKLGMVGPQPFHRCSKRWEAGALGSGLACSTTNQSDGHVARLHRQVQNPLHCLLPVIDDVAHIRRLARREQSVHLHKRVHARNEHLFEVRQHSQLRRDVSSDCSYDFSAVNTRAVSGAAQTAHRTVPSALSTKPEPPAGAARMRLRLRFQPKASGSSGTAYQRSLQLLHCCTTPCRRMHRSLRSIDCNRGRPGTRSLARSACPLLQALARGPLRHGLPRTRFTCDRDHGRRSASPRPRRRHLRRVVLQVGLLHAQAHSARGLS